MAKKRRKSRGRKAGSPPPVSEGGPAEEPAVVPEGGSGDPPATEPSGDSLWERFWTRPFHSLQLSAFRFFFFAAVAMESFRDLEHAPRYGAGGFNVPHFDAWAALPVPSRYGMVVLLLVQFALALRVAFGLGQRVTVWALTAVYGYTYFISQLDSYQHHYMVFLFLVLMSLVDWESESPRTWPVHLVIVQTCIVYFWAGITKAQPLWLDGTLLEMQVGRAFGEQVPVLSALGADTAFLVMSNYAMAMEFAVPLMILWCGLLPEGRPRMMLGWLTVVIGVPLHAGIELAGLRIGLFSYMMIAFYLLIVPRQAYARLAAMSAGMLRGLPSLEPSREHAVFVVSLAFTAWTVWQLPLEYTGAAAAAVTAVALFSEWPLREGRLGRALAHLLVGLTILYAATSGETMRKYWYYLGGDARRRGEVSLAIYGYSNTAAVDPGYESAYIRWARMLTTDQRHQEAREALELGAARVEDPTFDLYEALAFACQRVGDKDCARQAAAHAISKKPDPRMQAIFDDR
jgi:hypothetical protein